MAAVGSRMAPGVQVVHQNVESGLLTECDAEGGHGRGEIRVPVRADRLAVERQLWDALSLAVSGQVLVANAIPGQSKSPW